MIRIDRDAIRFYRGNEQVNAHFNQLNPFWMARGCWWGGVKNFFWGLREGFWLLKKEKEDT